MKRAVKGKPNAFLRQQRLLRGWSLQQVANEIYALCEQENRVAGVTAEMVGKWERGDNKPIPFYREKLCRLYSLSAAELGFIDIPALSPPGEVHPSQSAHAQANDPRKTEQTDPRIPVASAEVDKQPAILSASQERVTIKDIHGKQSLPMPDVSVEDEKGNQDINKSRRDFLQTLGIMSAGLITSPQGLQHYSLVRGHFPNLSEASITNLATITQQFREMQRHGDTFITNGLNAHINTIQDILERTLEDKKRRELWRVLAQSQLVARLNKHSTKKLELAQAKTLNESAIASAQNSGDRVLVGAAMGHLAHLYLREEDDMRKATELISQAQKYTQGHLALNGWFTIVKASIAAKEGKLQQCEGAIADAMIIAHQIPQIPQYADPYFTDFSVVSVNVFAGNCWLAVGNPKKAYELLAAINMEELAINRHASAFYDLSRAYVATGQLEAAQVYAFLSIDSALATNHHYIIPRFITLAHAIQQKDRHEPHAAAILEYVQFALQMS